jgi:nitrogenase-associated protein
MATIHFYEKPGCINNTRQKNLLIDAGHALIVYDLLKQPWNQERDKLRSFFGDMPVKHWFNQSAPAIKNGEIDPEIINEFQAIELMVATPLLIRRPLMEVNGQRCSGFDAEHIQVWLDMCMDHIQVDLETCPKQQESKACKP